MGRVLTNNISLAYTIETALGVAGTVWFLLEPEAINSFGASISTVAREPISRNRQRRKGTTVDLDSGAEFDHDLTISAFLDFIEGFCFVTGVNFDMDIAALSAETTGDSYETAALTAAQADKLEFAVGQYATLIFGRGFTNAANNGLKQVDADIASSATAISVAENLVDEAAPPATAQVELAGLRSLAAAADFTWDWDAGAKTGTLISAADITVFAQFGMTVGQKIHIGSPDGSGGVTNAFENSSANDMFGEARIKSIDAVAGQIVCDKVDAALQFDDLTAPTTAVDVLFGKFVRNVSTTSAEFLERSFQFEIEDPGLDGGNSEFEYSKGNFCNTAAFSLPLTDKAGIAFGFIGTDTDSPVVAGSRKSGASAATDPLETAAFNTTADIARLRIEDVDETGLTTDFKSLTITLDNQVSPEKVLGTLGAKFINTGNFLVNIEAQLIFTEGLVINRIRDNTTVSMDFTIKNDDGAIAVDIPSMTLGGGDREYPVNESVLINLTGEAFQDPTLDTSIGFSIFPVLP